MAEVEIVDQLCCVRQTLEGLSVSRMAGWSEFVGEKLSLYMSFLLQIKVQEAEINFVFQ